MAEALVSVLLEQLASITVQEAKQGISLVVGVDEEVQKLEDNLRIIQAVLENAKKRQMTDVVMKLWLKKFKDTSYNMDDVLDEWNTALIEQRIQEKEIAENAYVLKKVRFSIPYIPSWFSRVKKLGMRCDIAYKIKELNRTLDDIAKKRVAYVFKLTRDNEVVEQPTTTSFVDVFDICDRDKDKNHLVSNLLGKDSGQERNPIGCNDHGNSSTTSLQ